MTGVINYPSWKITGTANLDIPIYIYIYIYTSVKWFPRKHLALFGFTCQISMKRRHILQIIYHLVFLYRESSDSWFRSLPIVRRRTTNLRRWVFSRRSLASCLAPFFGLAAWCMDANLAGNTRCSFGANDDEKRQWHFKPDNPETPPGNGMSFSKIFIFLGLQWKITLNVSNKTKNLESWRAEPEETCSAAFWDAMFLNMIFAIFLEMLLDSNFKITPTVFVYGGMILQTLVDNTCNNCIEFLRIWISNRIILCQ